MFSFSLTFYFIGLVWFQITNFQTAMATRCSPTSNLESSPEKNEGIHKQIVHYNKYKLGALLFKVPQILQLKTL